MYTCNVILLFSSDLRFILCFRLLAVGGDFFVFPALNILLLFLYNVLHMKLDLIVQIYHRSCYLSERSLCYVLVTKICDMLNMPV
jgi:hypothetical protein